MWGARNHSLGKESPDVEWQEEAQRQSRKGARSAQPTIFSRFLFSARQLSFSTFLQNLKTFLNEVQEA